MDTLKKSMIMPNTPLSDISNYLILKFLQHSEYARLSFEKLCEIKEFKENVSQLFWIENKETDTQGYLYYDRHIKSIIISFRGSQQFKDWLNDFNAFHMVYPYGNEDSKIKVHNGFIKCYKSIRQSLLDYFDRRFVQNPIHINKIFFTGHSLGGALATLAAVDFQYNYPMYSPRIVGYVSGNPAVFNKYGKESFKKRVPDFTRTFSRKDWVPYLPPKWFGSKLHGGYHHVGTPNPIGPKDWLFGFKVWIKTLRKPKNLAENLSNHAISLYRMWLENE